MMHEPKCPAGVDVRLKRLVLEHGAGLRRYLLRLGVPDAELDDVTQEVLVIVASKLPFVAPGGERAFVFATATRVAANARRARVRRHRAYESYVHVPFGAPLTQEELADERRARVWLDTALGAMPNDLRGVFVLAELEELPIHEIAHRLDLPIGTAASRLRRARDAFQQHLVRLRHRGPTDDLVSREGTLRRAPAANDDAVAQLLSWWVTDGEVDALAALLAVHRHKYPHARVAPSGVKGTATAKTHLRNRMGEDRPPDTFQATGGYDLLRWVKPDVGRPGARLHSLEPLYESEGWASVIPADVGELVRCDGEAFGVPLNIHRTNTLVYNTALFEAHGLVPPTSLGELHVTARTLLRRGVTPLALGTRAPWMLTLLAFENILVAVAGPIFYRELFTGRGHPESPELREALGELWRLLAVTNADAGKLTWDEGALRVGEGSAAMTIGGDWINGHLQRRGYRPAVDFSTAPTPGTSHAFVFSTDTFALPARARHVAEAQDLLRVMGSRDGQVAFSLRKGSLPVRSDVDLTGFDPLARRTRADFDAAVRVPTLTSLVPTSFSTALDAAMSAFAVDGAIDAVVATVRKHYAMLRSASPPSVPPPRRLVAT